VTPPHAGNLTRIVLTGGPGAGKTVIADALADASHLEEWRRQVGGAGGVMLVPEAATQVYASRRTRWDRLDLSGRCEVQREIYRFQRTQEDRLAALAHERGAGVLLLDRGTIDGSAYWPHGPADYWRDLGVELADELLRYDAVLLLESAAALGSHLYDGEASNAVRFEDAPAALESGRLLETLWGRHPRLIRIAATADLDEKIHAVAQTIRSIAAAPA
jgi:predicted ATPase